MLRALIIGPDEVARAEAITNFASSRVYRPGSGVPPPGDDPRHVAQFLLGFRCVFSITEIDRTPWRHLSVSVDRCGLPAPLAVEMLGHLFGFVGPLDSWVGGPHGDAKCIVVAQRLAMPSLGGEQAQDPPALDHDILWGSARRNRKER